MDCLEEPPFEDVHLPWLRVCPPSPGPVHTRSQLLRRLRESREAEDPRHSPGRDCCAGEVLVMITETPHGAICEVCGCRLERHAHRITQGWQTLWMCGECREEEA